MDASNLGCGQYDVFWSFSGEEGLHGGLIAQFSFGMGACDNVGVTLPVKFAYERTARQTATPRHINFCVFVHLLIRSNEV